MEARSFPFDEIVWKEIIDRKREFQEMLALLLFCDERSGRLREYGEPELHYLRKAAVVADPNCMRIYLRELSPRIYYVVIEMSTGGGRMATAYVHEDGIRSERREHGGHPEHPVHTVVCLSDLFDDDPLSARVLPEDLYEIGPGAPGDMALDLMTEDSLFVD